MSIKEVKLGDGCISCGQSQDTAPEVFRLEIGTGAVFVEGVSDYGPHEEKLRQAVKNCPVDNISLVED